MRHYRGYPVLLIIAGIYLSCACSGAAGTKKEMDKKVEIYHAETAMDYHTAVSDLVKGADTMIISTDKGKYESARLLIKGDTNLDLSGYEGVCKVIADPEGHYTVQFTSSAYAKKASEKLNALDQVEYSEPDGAMGTETDGAYPGSWNSYGSVEQTIEGGQYEKIL